MTSKLSDLIIKSIWMDVSPERFVCEIVPLERSAVGDVMSVKFELDTSGG